MWLIYVLIVGIRPPINVTINENTIQVETTIQVEPGRQLHIVCESLGEYSGDVEWKQVNDSGILMNTHFSTIMSIQLS